MEKPIEKALDECLFSNVKGLNRILDKLADEAFRGTGLAPTYGFILLILKEEDGIPQEDITQIFYSVLSAIVRFVEKLEYKEYIKTVSEGRLSLVYLTEQGRRFAKEVGGSWEELHQLHEAALGNEVSKESAQTMDDAADKLQKK